MKLSPPSSFLIHTFFVVLLALLVPAFFAPTATAGERSVTAAEANGTYRDVEGKSEIKIVALGHGKLKVQLALVYEYQSGAGPAANVGDASGEATIENDIAVFVPEEAGDCKITMTFLPNGKLKVEQQGEECGFGTTSAPTAPFGKSATANQSSTTLDAHAGTQSNDFDLVFLSTSCRADLSRRSFSEDGSQAKANQVSAINCLRSCSKRLSTE
jgi:hypothetical protein